MESGDSEPLLSDDETTATVRDEQEDSSTVHTRSTADDPSSAAKVTRLRTINVEPVLVLYFLAFVPSRMLIEQFLYTMISEEHNVTSIVRLDQNETHCTVNSTDPHFITHELIQDEASRWAMYLKFMQCVPSMFIALVCGTISDKVSRKLPILLPLFASALQIGMCIMMILLRLPKPYLFLAYAIDGLSGSYITLLMGCFAYTGNATSHGSRSLRISVNELCIGIAISLSDVGIGYMIKQFGFFYPFLIILGIQFVNILYALFLLQETLTKSFSRTTVSCHQFFEPFRIYFKDRPDNKRWKLFVVQLIFWCYAFGSIGRNSVATLYLQNVPFCFNAKLLGYYIAVSAVVYGLGNIIPVALLKNRNSDAPLLIASAISACASMVLLAFSDTVFLLYTVIFVAVFHQLGYTILRTLMSKQVTPTEQGAVFASIAFLETTSELLGNITFNSIYSATLLLFRGFVFLVVAGVFLLGTLLSIVLYCKDKTKPTSDYSLVTDGLSLDMAEAEVNGHIANHTEDNIESLPTE